MKVVKDKKGLEFTASDPNEDDIVIAVFRGYFYVLEKRFDGAWRFKSIKLKSLFSFMNFADSIEKAVTTACVDVYFLTSIGEYYNWLKCFLNKDSLHSFRRIVHSAKGSISISEISVEHIVSVIINGVPHCVYKQNGKFSFGSIDGRLEVPLNEGIQDMESCLSHAIDCGYRVHAFENHKSYYDWIGGLSS
ncbi:MAG: hypothetical protein GY861_22080 [bacterium]|nr:hypothetical protein [bacterium]